MNPPHTHSLDDLRQLGYLSDIPFQVVLPDTQGVFNSQHITRILPGKRISCLGRWQNKTVFGKFFIASQRADRHWQDELKGIHRLYTCGLAHPKVLQQGTLYDGLGYYILFEKLESATDFQTLWDQSPDDEQIQLLHDLTRHLAQMHDRGVIQKDLHLSNFMRQEGLIYTLDGAGLVNVEPSDVAAAIDNLALLFAQVVTLSVQHIDTLIETYQTARHIVLNSTEFKTLQQRIQQQIDNRKAEYIKKTTRSCRLFIYEKNSKQLAIFPREAYFGEMLDFKNNPDLFVNQGLMIKNGNTCTVVKSKINGRDVIIKRYNIKSPTHFLSRALRPSRAMISWQNAHLLKFYGIPTPEPLAVIEQRWNGLRKTAYFVTEYLSGQTGYDYFLQGAPDLSEEQIQMVQPVTDLVNTLHQYQIAHGDLKITNFLIHSHKVYLIDLDAMQQYQNAKLFQTRQQKDQARLLKNWENHPVLSQLFEQQLQKP